MVDGYKKTDIGVIPEEWDILNTNDIIKNNGIKIGPFGSALKKELLVKKGFKVYGQENIFDKNMNIGNRYITKQHFQKLKTCELKPGDFIISMMGTIGKSIIIPNDIETGIMDSHLLRLRFNQKIYKDYFSFIFSSKLTFNQVEKLSVGGIMDGLSSKIIKNLHYPIPPLPEQKAIAAVLSDTDELIHTLEKRIAKKRNIKQGAMQKLITPKENWETKKLGELSVFLKGKGLPKSDITEEGTYQCIHYGELFIKYKETIEDIISQTNTSENCFYSKRNDVLMPTSDVTPNGLATASCLKKDNIILGGDILVIRIPEELINGTFFSYYISQNRNKVMKLVSGSTVYHLYGSDMSTFDLSYPKLEEQNRIATILSDMDKELTQLEEKLEKYKSVKQGLMQQ